MQRKRKTKAIIVLLVFLALSYVAYPLSFTTLPSIDNNTQSSENILCYWNASTDTTQANVTWYNASVFYSSAPNANSPESLDTVNTKRGETWTCEVTISNTTDTASMNATVIVKNSDPQNLKIYNQSDDADLWQSQTLYEDTSYTFYLNATDYDLDSLLYSWSLFNPIPAGSELNQSTGVFTWTPGSDNEAGSHNVTFLAFDPYDGVDSLSFLMTVIAVNDAPVFSPALAGRQATEGVYFEYNISATDEENNLPLNFTIISDGGIGLSLLNLSNTSARLYFTPAFADAGNHTIIINVTDSNAASAQGQFSLEVLAVNHIPFFTFIQNSSALQNQQFLMRVNASDNDTSDNLTFSIAAVNCPVTDPWSITTAAASANNSVGIINVSGITNDQIICREVNISVTDSKSVNYTLLTLNITNVNDKPVIYENSTYPVNSHNNTNIYSLSAYAYSQFRYRLNFTDPDSLTYEGESLHAATNFTAFNITLDNATGELVFTTNSTGIYYLLMNVSDDEGLFANVTLTINISQNSVPVIQPIPNMSTNESEAFSYNVNASDAEGGVHYYTNASSALFIINLTTGLISFTPNQSQVGNYSIRAWVEDEVGATAQAYFTIEVKNKNDPPILSPVNFPLMVADHEFNYTVAAADKDMDGTLPLQYEYDYLTFWTNSTLFTINATTGLISFTPNQSQAGNYSAVIGVNDSMGLSDSEIINFTVYNVSQPPVIVNITPYGPPPTKFTWNQASSFSQG